MSQRGAPGVAVACPRLRGAEISCPTSGSIRIPTLVAPFSYRRHVSTDGACCAPCRAHSDFSMMSGTAVIGVAADLGYDNVEVL